MEIPVTFKIPKDFRERYLRWTEDRGLLGNTTFDWTRGLLTFENQSDATAFYLETGIPRYKTLAEQKLENETSQD